MSLTMRLIGRAAKGALGLARDAVDPDRAVQLGMSGLIEAARTRHGGARASRSSSCSPATSARETPARTCGSRR